MELSGFWIEIVRFNGYSAKRRESKHILIKRQSPAIALWKLNFIVQKIRLAHSQSTTTINLRRNPPNRTKSVLRRFIKHLSYLRISAIWMLLILFIKRQPKKNMSGYRNGWVLRMKLNFKKKYQLMSHGH